MGLAPECKAMIVLVVAALGSLEGVSRASAQDVVLPVVLPGTEQRLLDSEAVGVRYKLYVSLPGGYESSELDYPVVYVLDADYSFAIARNVMEHLSDRGDLPPSILVGIAYDGPDAYRANRTRDYTPTYVPTAGYGLEYQAVSGGAPKFRQFISDELVPFVEREYRASSQRTLVGHSYGGLFATWVAFTDPTLFGGYVIVSPSLWYDDAMIFDVEEHASSQELSLIARLYFSVGSREVNAQHDMVADLRRLAAAVETGPYPSLALSWEVAANETHNSIFPRALSSGLRFVMEGRE
jgi:predicted alpha/beta superfamily hydrolase